MVKLEDISNNSKDQGYVPKSPNQKYNLSWFHPQGKQQLYSNEIDSYDTVLVQAPSGCGKSSLAVWRGSTILARFSYLGITNKAIRLREDPMGSQTLFIELQWLMIMVSDIVLSLSGLMLSYQHLKINVVNVLDVLLNCTEVEDSVGQ